MCELKVSRMKLDDTQIKTRTRLKEQWHERCGKAEAFAIGSACEALSTSKDNTKTNTQNLLNVIMKGTHAANNDKISTLRGELS